jgi:hypothetical protein
MFPFVQPSLHKEDKTLYLDIPIIFHGEEKDIRNEVRVALDGFRDRVELLSFKPDVVKRQEIKTSFGDKLMVIRFPVKLYTQHELKCKKYRESFIKTFID